MDEPSRYLSKSESMLSRQAWSRVQAAFGGRCGHSLDLMALESNAQRHLSGNTLPHFTPCASKEAAGLIYLPSARNLKSSYGKIHMFFRLLTWWVWCCGSFCPFTFPLLLLCLYCRRFPSAGRFCKQSHLIIFTWALRMT